MSSSLTDSDFRLTFNVFLPLAAKSLLAAASNSRTFSSRYGGLEGFSTTLGSIPALARNSCALIQLVQPAR